MISLFYDGYGTVKWIGYNGRDDYSPAGILGCLPRCLCLPWVMDEMTQYLTKINGLDLDMMLSIARRGVRGTAGNRPPAGSPVNDGPASG